MNVSGGVSFILPINGAAGAAAAVVVAGVPLQLERVVGRLVEALVLLRQASLGTSTCYVSIKL